MSTGPLPTSTVPALDIRGLTVLYGHADDDPVAAVSDVTLSIMPGEIHAVVGESGAGKTTVGNALMGLLQAPGRIAGGTISIGGKVVNTHTGRAEGIVAGRDVGAIFQDPMTSLNPLFTIESQLCEGLRHHLGVSGAAARARALDLLNAVGIPEPERRLKCYPHQLSGGQRQRVVIASALSCDPNLIVADEPTTALDVSVQAQILKLIRNLADDRRVGVLLVTHNMGVVAQIADRVTIMLKGRVVESGPVAEVLRAPQHPYAVALIGAVPRIDIKVRRLAAPSEESAAAAAARQKVRSKMTAGGKQAGADLAVEGLQVDYGGRSWFPGRASGRFRAVDGVSFTVRPGEIFGLVGESGCGKTTVANAIAGLVSPTAGSIRLSGEEIGRDKRHGRALQMVFQDPYSALNPRLRVRTALAEPVAFYRLASTAAEVRADAASLLEAVGLDGSAGERFPYAFSGGERQRIAIARALAPRPRFLVCDEPTSSLDVSVQAQILNLLKDLRDLTGLSMLFISHDLAVVRQMCDRIAVMKGGQIVELAETDRLFEAPQHPYTRELLSFAPSLDKVARAAAPANGTSADV